MATSPTLYFANSPAIPQHHSMKLRALFLPALLLAVTSLAFFYSHAAEPVKPLKVLLVLGGCCHDYTNQQDILKKGIEARVNSQVDILFSPEKGTAPRFADYERADWAKGYDVVIHDECAADIMEKPYVENIVNAHKNGVPAVNLHCAMHSYRKGFKAGEPMAPGSEEAIWFDFLGLQSNRHGPQEPIAVTYLDKTHPITKDLADWTTIKEELYNNVQPPKNFPGHVSLATGKQSYTDKKTNTLKTDEAVIVWTNLYGPNKTRVFSTTLGHNNDTVADARYLDLVTRGMLWTVGKLGDDGKPAAGYEAMKK
jgi:type 1 glutamine amidotransferase